MLSYSVQVGETEDQSSDINLSASKPLFNPFPGLRPFALDESHLFFGREGQVDEILLKLSEHRSVTVMGYSGSGKSSLMYCGLVPVLYGGFMTHTSPYWQVIPSRPGNSPITNLTNSILDHLTRENHIEEEDRLIKRAIIGSVLRSGSHGLIDVAKYLQTKEGENIFFLIDQFEELFRFKDSANDEFANEAALYVNLILTALSQRETPIYMAINMRSDFIGDCAAFPGLTQMINASNYLVPQMTRDQKRMAIEGPIAVGGGRISSRLVKRLMTDIGDNQDQLPIMQHALMRTWDYWMTNREPSEPMDIRHYNAIGKISQALSLHANEAYEELSSREKEIAEVLFKNITEKNQENQGIRRPIKIKALTDLTDADEEEVIKVVDQFRKAGRSFILPGSHIPLHGDSIIELSHESMMRIWTRLSTWVEEEFESAQTYKRISDAAAMYQIGKTGLWRPPDLQLALNWQKKQKPTRSWAQRYDIAFERAIVFLDTSRITYEAELKNQEMLQRRMLRRARVLAVVFGAFALIAILFFVYALTQQIEAEKQRQAAVANEKNAELAKVDAERARELAEAKTIEVEQKNIEIIKANADLERAFNDVRLAKAKADSLLIVANRQTALAIKETAHANEEAENALRQYNRAEQALSNANRLLMLSIAQTLEVKSVAIEDPQLAGLTAMQGYLYHTKYEGNKYDPYVFSGLYYANTKLKDLTYNAIKMPGNLKNRMFALAVSKNSTSFYTTGNDGRIFKGDYQGKNPQVMLAANPFSNRVLALSKDEQYLVNGSDSSAIQIYNLMNPTSKPVTVAGHKGFINDIKFLPDDSGFISAASDKTLRFTNQRTGESKQLLSLSFDLKSIDISPDGKSLIGSSAAGRLVFVNLVNNSMTEIEIENEVQIHTRILSVAFHPTRQMIAYGTEILNEKNIPTRGTVKLYDLAQRKELKVLTGHKAGVSDLEFSPDGLLLASAGLDRKLQMWVVDHENDLPIVMDNNNGNIWDITFTKNSDFLLASCNNGEIRIWPTNPRTLAEQICPKLERNMSPEEWDIYVANKIPYETTCQSLLIKSF